MWARAEDLVPRMLCCNGRDEGVFVLVSDTPKFKLFMQLKSISSVFYFIIRTVDPFRLKWDPIKYNGPANFPVGHSCWPLLHDFLRLTYAPSSLTPLPQTKKINYLNIKTLKHFIFCLLYSCMEILFLMGDAGVVTVGVCVGDES